MIMKIIFCILFFASVAKPRYLWQYYAMDSKGNITIDGKFKSKHAFTLKEVGYRCEISEPKLDSSVDGSVFEHAHILCKNGSAIVSTVLMCRDEYMVQSASANLQPYRLVNGNYIFNTVYIICSKR